MRVSYKALFGLATLLLCVVSLQGTLAAKATEFLPGFDNPKLRFGTGQSQDNQPQISPLLPNIAGPPSAWYVAQWHQDSLLSGAKDYQDMAGKSDPYLGKPRYGFTAPDGHAHLWIYQPADNGHLVYEIFERGGWVAQGGGSNIFLSANTLPPGPKFDHPLRFSMRVRLTAADIAYGRPTAKQSGAVLGMAFTGFVIQFPSPLNGKTSTLLMQIALANSLERSRPLLTCRMAGGALRLLFGGSLAPKLPFTFSPSSAPLQRVSYDLNSYLNAVFGQRLNCSEANGKSQEISLAQVDRGQTVIRAVYLGLETEHIDKRPGADDFGAPQGHVAVGLQVSDVQLNEMP